MPRRLRPVQLDFADSAPLRLRFGAETEAAPEAVYAALAEDVEGWAQWFTAVSSAVPDPDGTGREVRLAGGGFFAETILAARPVQRYAYRIDVTNAPGVTALLEDWRVAASGTGGSRVSWTVAADGPAPLRALLRVARPGLAVSFLDAVRRLDRRLLGEE